MLDSKSLIGQDTIFSESKLYQVGKSIETGADRYLHFPLMINIVILSLNVITDKQLIVELKINSYSICISLLNL